MPAFYDTHAHLDSPAFSADLPEVLARAQEAGIERIVAVGTDAESSARAVALAERYPSVWAAVGWHPTHVQQAPEDIRPWLRELAQHPRVVAIGEIGLDYFHRAAPDSTPEQEARYREKQAAVFQQQLEVAADLHLNCIIHTRQSFAAALARLRPMADRVRGVFHCFAEDPAAMRQVLDLGSLVSFTGILTFKNGQNIRDTLAATPLGGFMLETDSPYLAPLPHRGRRCEPAYVADTARVAAQVKGCGAEELSAATGHAARGFFRGWAG